MSKPFDYSKWDKIELSDDEEDVHPNIDRESWFRMKHRSRVEREANEEKDKKRINAEMDKANKRIQVLEHDLEKLKTTAAELKDEDDDDDDDDIDGREAILAEIEDLKRANATRQAKLDEYEKNKKWNVDNMCHVVEERTIINPNGAKANYTPTGFAKSTTEDAPLPKATTEATTTTKSPKPAASKPTKEIQTTAIVEKKEAKPAPKKEAVVGPKEDANVSMMSYYEFTQKYADLVENFMKIQDLKSSKEFLMKNGNILLQENASNYLLLASLEDEMNGFREKMKQTARQSQIISSIADLAKTLNTHPGNVITPFFARLEQKEHLDAFVDAVNSFVEKIIKRAITKKVEMDREREGEEGAGVDLADIPKEERLGPGGLDPLEVVLSLPEEMQEAFESRDVEALKTALSNMEPQEAQYHMKRCIDSGLWTQG